MKHETTEPIPPLSLPSSAVVFNLLKTVYSDPEVIKLFTCSTPLSMIFFLFINVTMPTTVHILAFMSGKNYILGFCEPKIYGISLYFHTCEHLQFHAQLS